MKYTIPLAALAASMTFIEWKNIQLFPDFEFFNSCTGYPNSSSIVECKFVLAFIAGVHNRSPKRAKSNKMSALVRDCASIYPTNAWHS